MRIGAHRLVDDRVDCKPGDDCAGGVKAEFVGGDDLLGGQDDTSGGEHQVSVHQLITVDLCIPELVGTLDVDQRDVRVETSARR